MGNQDIGNKDMGNKDLKNKDRVEAQIKHLKELRELAEMNRRQFSEYMEIPLRTMEEWESGRRKMPDYVLRLISYRVRMEKMLRDNRIESEVFYDK